MIERQIIMQDVMEILVNSHEDVLRSLYPRSIEWIEINVYIFYFNF